MCSSIDSLSGAEGCGDAKHKCETGSRVFLVCLANKKSGMFVFYCDASLHDLYGFKRIDDPLQHFSPSFFISSHVFSIRSNRDFLINTLLPTD